VVRRVEAKEQRDSILPVIGGILNIISGILGLIGGLMLIVIGPPLISYVPKLTIPTRFGIVLTVMGVFFLVCGVIAIYGGICAIEREKFVWALIGGIFALLLVLFLGLPGLILIILAKDEFTSEMEKQKQ
jgi:uncharacterized BrkB/YihY/UPF0761 family membrane protein